MYFHNWCFSQRHKKTKQDIFRILKLVIPKVGNRHSQSCQVWCVKTVKRVKTDWYASAVTLFHQNSRNGRKPWPIFGKKTPSLLFVRQGSEYASGLSLKFWNQCVFLINTDRSLKFDVFFVLKAKLIRTFYVYDWVFCKNS